MYGSLLFLGWGAFLKHVTLPTAGLVLVITALVIAAARVEITIVGGELLSALGSGDRRMAALRQARVRTATVSIDTPACRLTFPHYRLDAGPRKARAGYIEH